MVTREDIESFGFKHKSKSICNWYECIDTQIPDIIADYGYWNKIVLQHCADRNTVTIAASEYAFPQTENGLFSGVLNTKEELAFVLKATGIIK